MIATSLETVDSARPNRPAIPRNDSPPPSPRDISSRSVNESRSGDRRRSAGGRWRSFWTYDHTARGEDVDASEYTFRTSTQIETAEPALDWLNKGVFISVAGRQPGRVTYDTYLVG